MLKFEWTSMLNKKAIEIVKHKIVISKNATVVLFGFLPESNWKLAGYTIYMYM